MTWLIIGALIVLSIISPLFGIILLAIFLHWRFKEFFWRLRMAQLIFFAVLIVGFYLSSLFGGLLSWFLK